MTSSSTLDCVNHVHLRRCWSVAVETIVELDYHPLSRIDSEYSADQEWQTALSLIFQLCAQILAKKTLEPSLLFQWTIGMQLLNLKMHPSIRVGEKLTAMQLLTKFELAQSKWRIAAPWCFSFNGCYYYESGLNVICLLLQVLVPLL